MFYVCSFLWWNRKLGTNLTLRSSSNVIEVCALCQSHELYRSATSWEVCSKASILLCILLPDFLMCWSSNNVFSISGSTHIRDFFCCKCILHLMYQCWSRRRWMQLYDVNPLLGISSPADFMEFNFDNEQIIQVLEQSLSAIYLFSVFHHLNPLSRDTT